MSGGRRTHRYRTVTPRELTSAGHRGEGQRRSVPTNVMVPAIRARTGAARLAIEQWPVTGSAVGVKVFAATEAQAHPTDARIEYVPDHGFLAAIRAVLGRVLAAVCDRRIPVEIQDSRGIFAGCFATALPSGLAVRAPRLFFAEIENTC